MHSAHRIPTRGARRPARLRACLLAALLALPAAHAESPPGPEEKHPEPDPPWREADTELPSFPTAETLVPLMSAAPGTDYRYFIDVDSVSVDVDGVSRYTVVIVAPGGASNVFYEAIRCDTQETKPYAYGTRAGKFEEMPSTEWTKIYSGGSFAYRSLLADRYMCDRDGWPMDIDTVLERIVRLNPRGLKGRPKRPEESGGADSN
ncbi:MAG: CNP1-like family protein [Gammaproteobacteria bacterium]|nr:CNP1-like family protein [Gammaproteobacteria bacterium]